MGFAANYDCPTIHVVSQSFGTPYEVGGKWKKMIHTTPKYTYIGATVLTLSIYSPNPGHGTGFARDTCLWLFPRISPGGSIDLTSLLTS
jgi:hypothetical protein